MHTPFDEQTRYRANLPYKRKAHTSNPAMQGKNITLKPYNPAFAPTSSDISNPALVSAYQTETAPKPKPKTPAKPCGCGCEDKPMESIAPEPQFTDEPQTQDFPATYRYDADENNFDDEAKLPKWLPAVVCSLFGLVLFLVLLWLLQSGSGSVKPTPIA